MKFGYADPPYLGCGKLYKHQHPDAWDWDRPEKHQMLIGRLNGDFPDGWALSCSSPSLPYLLSFCPAGVRVAAWVKPFCIFKPNVNPAYAWEPVIWKGGRKHTRTDPTIRDWVSESITLKRNLTGAKPRGFCRWLFELLNMKPGDEFVDLFPGTGAVSIAWSDFVGDETAQIGMFAAAE